jgi:DNA-binding transcriptional MerR regulator
MPKKNDGLYGKRLSGKWRDAFTDAQDHDFENIVRESFYVAHGRILSTLEGAGKFSKEGKTLLQACEILVEQGELTFEFVEELKLRLLGLDLNGMLAAFQGTLALADGAVRLSKMGDVRRQLDICKAFIVAILQKSQDRMARELALACIQQLKLDADLPLEELEKLIHDAQEESGDQEEDASEETQEEVQRTEEDVLTCPENILEGDIWGDGNIESTAAEEISRSSETGEN